MKTLVLTLIMLFQAQAVFAQKDTLINLFALRWEENEKYTSSSAIHKLNQKTMEDIAGFVPVLDLNRSTWITKEQAEKIRTDMYRHPVVGEHRLEYYDPEGRFGFCFVRALYAHLELLRRNVSKQSIKKVFVVGEMDDKENPFWDYHVATAVKGPDQVWWVIDTWVKRVMTVEEWFNEMNKMSTDGRLRLYVTEPNRIGPQSWKYNIEPGGLFSYNNIVQDLFQYNKENPVPENKKFRNIPLTYDMPRSCRTILN